VDFLDDKAKELIRVLYVMSVRHEAEFEHLTVRGNDECTEHFTHSWRKSHHSFALGAIEYVVLCGRWHIGVRHRELL